MAWIQNISFADANNGNYPKVMIHNTVRIQIVDPDMDFPVTPDKFLNVHQFKFLDVEKDTDCDESLKISQEQASKIVKILQDCLDNEYNVVVNCVAGCNRSGAVTEVGVMMGFDDTGAYRGYNCMVKYMLMKELGWTYE